MSDILELNHVSKRFRNQVVLEDVNYTFQSGRIYGIIGENGCGKSVLLKLLCGLMIPSEGTVVHNGKVLKKDIDILPSLGVIIENPGFFDEMNALDNLKIFASFQKRIGTSTIIEAISKVGLENTRKKVENYSLGMRQRLGLAQAIMENPDILILDEFTTALDKEGVEMAHQLLNELRQEGKMILITSHSSHDINELCDQVLVIRDRRLYVVEEQ